jgi:2-phospho-L-lactate guanylyltransferase
MAQVVIAVRGGRTAKSRCAGTLSGGDRARLTVVMLEDMLAALGRCEDVSQAWVVTPTPDLAAIARDHGARVISQLRAAGLNAALRLAIDKVCDTAPYDPLILMPGDLPLLQPDDLSAALLLARTHEVTLAPALDGGTGLLALRAGAVLAPTFGPRSFQRHAAAAARRGLSVAVIKADSLSRDVDRPDDLIDVMQCGSALRTATFLRERLKPRIRS